MSISGARAAIVAALSTVSGIKGYPQRPRAPKPGDAWPAAPSFALVDDLILEPTWPVIVMLPQDKTGTAQAAFVEQHIESLFAALKGPGWPESAEPATITADGVEQDVYVITVRSQ